MKIAGDIEINLNILCACSLSKRNVSNTSGTALGVKLKLLQYDHGDVQLIESQYVRSTTATTTIKVKVIKVKISGNFELSQNTQCA